MRKYYKKVAQNIVFLMHGEFCFYHGRN